jgi:hypothetical protein
MDQEHAVVLVDVCFPLNPQLHAKLISSLQTLLSDSCRTCNFQLCLVGCGAPHHRFAVQPRTKILNLDELKKEISALRFDGGGFGSCLWDGVACCFETFMSAPNSPKNLIIVPSSIPEFQHVKFFKKYLNFRCSEFCDLFVKNNIRVSWLSSFPSADLDALFIACGGASSSLPGWFLFDPFVFY